MEYPEQAMTVKILKSLNLRLQQHWAAGDSILRLDIKRQDKAEEHHWFSTSEAVRAGVYVMDAHRQRRENLAAELGLQPAEFALRLARLEQSGYVNLKWPIIRNPSKQRITGRTVESPTSADVVWVNYVTESGLVVIGELPDPQAQLIRGFEAAIEAIKYDRSLTDREKRQKINWLQEGTVIARTLSMDAIKAILAGAIL